MCERREAIDSPEWMSSPYLLMRPVEFDKIRAVVEAAYRYSIETEGRKGYSALLVLDSALKDLGVTNEAE